MYTFRLLFIVIVVVIPLNILTLILSNTVVNEVERQVSTEMENALELYMSQVDGAMKRIAMKMHSMAMNDTDFARINGKEIASDEEYYRQMQAVVNLHTSFEDVLNDNSWITGVYVMYPDKDIQVVRSVNDYNVYADGLEAYIAEFIRQDEQTRLNRWVVTDFGTIPSLIFIGNFKNAYYGAWIDLKRLAGTLGFSKREQELATMFLSEVGEVYYSNNKDVEWKEPEEFVQAGWRKNYTLVRVESEVSDLSIVQIFSRSEINSSLPVMIRALQAASIAALFILPVLLFCMQKWVIMPVSKLTNAITQIEAGNMGFRIQEEGTGSEFEQINHNFNHMMDEVSRLKINVYEEQLEKQQIKMRFLSQQIQPHFILNTLNILYSYEQDEYLLIQKMILCLSRYFRYIVNANSDFVRMREEMEHIRNYFEIQQARYPRTFFAMVEYDEEIADCLIPPLLIQNFAENAIKHSLRIGNKIDIFVIAQRYGENAVRIRMMDTGEGISEELIRKVDKFRATGEYQEGLGVGIQNAVERLQVLYGVESGFSIARDEPHGTRIEFILPMHIAEFEEDN